MSIPVVAIGGITPDRVGAVRQAGAHGVAVISAILAAPSPADRRPASSSKNCAARRAWNRRSLAEAGLAGPATMKIIVVGGGVIGCAIAYQLAKAGRAVTLLERATPAPKPPGPRPGSTTPGEPADTAFHDLAIPSWRLYPAVREELRERTGVDSSTGRRHDLSAVHGRGSSAGRGPRGVGSPRRVRHRGVGSRRSPRSGTRALQQVERRHVRGRRRLGDNPRLVVAYAQAGVSAGIVLQTGCNVSRLVVEGGRVWRGGRARANRGRRGRAGRRAWTAALTENSGCLVAVEPRRGQTAALTHVSAVLRHCIHGDDVYPLPRAVR